MLSEIVKKKFLPYGEFIEPFKVEEITFDFFAHLETSLVHTTFFMKDYEIKSFLYVFGKKYQKLTINEFKHLWITFQKISKKLLKAPEDHYLSSFILFVEVEEAEETIKEVVINSFSSKNIWFGLKGSYHVGVALFSRKEKVYPKEISSYVSWIFENKNL
ncbi:MAG: hypothetical protein ABGX27_09255 [Desulfurobacteriaceae bacterium]